MKKPLNEFGGWLKFFYVVNWLEVIFASGLVLLMIFILFGQAPTFDKGIAVLTIVDTTITLVIAIKYLSLVKIQEPSTPARIVRLMAFLVIATIVLGALEIGIIYAVKGTEKLDDNIGTIKQIVRTLIWFLIWSNYFKKSKRVAAYYRTVPLT